LDRDSQVSAVGEVTADSDYSAEWLAGAVDRQIHDPYALYESLSQEVPA
jgi:uncharacterized glyoxalase superfamily metalloenzyme YdcJ